MSAARRGRNVLVNLAGNAFAPLASLGTAPILAHALGVDGRGATAAAVAPLSLAVTIATLGMPSAVTYLTARSPRLLRAVAARAALVSLVIGLAATGLILLLVAELSGNDPSIAGFIVFASFAIVPTLLAGVLQGAAAGLHAWRLVATERCLTAAIRFGAVAALALAGELTVMRAVAVTAGAPLLGALVYLRLLRRPTAATTEVGIDSAGLRNVLSYGSRIWLGSISGVVLARIDQTLMTPLAGAAELGLYVVAVSIADLGIVVNTAVREVMFSSDAKDGDVDALARAARLSTLATMVVGVVVAASAWWWLPIVFGPGFGAALPTLLVLLLANVIGNPGSLAGVGLSARGRPGLRSTSLAVAAGVNLVAVVLLVPVLGALGAALATLIGNAVSGNGNIAFLWRRFGVDPRKFLGVRRSDLILITSACMPYFSTVYSKCAQVARPLSSRIRQDPS